MSSYLRRAYLFFKSGFICLGTEKPGVLDLSEKLRQKKELEEKNRLKQELQEFVKTEPGDVAKNGPVDELEVKREQKFLSEVAVVAGVWMHRFSDVSKDERGFYIAKSDNPAGSRMRVGDELSDYAINQTPYWKISSISGDRINLEPINSNPFVTGIGAGGAKLTKYDVDVYSGAQERKRIEQINEAIEAGKADIDTLKYVLLGTVPVQFGPNGAQGGWYTTTDTNRGGMKGMRAREIMMADVKTIKDHGLVVPVKALDGTMSPEDWNRWVNSNGSESKYFPKNVDKYVEFSKKMTEKGKYRLDEDSLQREYRKYSPEKLEAYYEEMLADVTRLTSEEWKSKHPYYEQNIKTVTDLYQRDQREQEKLKNSFSEYFVEGEDATLESILRGVFSPERRVSNRNVMQLVEMCQEDENYIKYLYDIINLGGSKDYLTNEHIIRFFHLVDDVQGLKLAAEKLKHPENIRHVLSYLYEQGEQDLVLDKLQGITDLETINNVLGKLHIEYDRSEIRKSTFGRNDKLLKAFKDNNVLETMQKGVEKDSIYNAHYAGEIASMVLHSFGPNMLWVPGDEELVQELRKFK